MIKINNIASVLVYFLISQPGSAVLPFCSQSEPETGSLLNFHAHAEKIVTSIISKVPGPKYELVIEIELTRFQGRSHRPYVAIWVENEKAEPVRTLALWFNDYRWLPDLKKWYSKHFEKILGRSDIDAISGATRPAGKYIIRWDGRDYKNNLLNEGKYTVFIEIVREKGTYQLIRQDFHMNEQNQRYELAEGNEVSSAVIEYRRKDSTEPAP